MGVATGGTSALPAASSLSHSSIVAVPAGLDTNAGSIAAMHASFERPMTAAASSSMAAGSSLGAAGMAGMFGQIPLARPGTAAVHSDSQSGGL